MSDKAPTESGFIDDVREAMCTDPAGAYFCALYVDKAPTDTTRKAVSELPNWAYHYIEDLDKGKIHPIFIEALKPLVLTGDEWAVRIFNEFEEMADDDT